MKKLIICLLLICTICLGCFALTACDNSSNSESNIKCELLSNTYEEINTSYYNSPVNLEYNLYHFRIWYSEELFAKGIHFPVIKCNSKHIVSFFNPTFLYPGFKEFSTRYNGVYGEYLLDYKSTKYSVKPNSWLYFSISLVIQESDLNPQITISLCDSSNEESAIEFAKYQIDLSDTYKTN